MKSQQCLRWLSAVAGVALAIGAGSAAAQKTQLNVYTALETDQIKAYEAAFNKSYPDIELKFTRDSTGVITAKVLAEKANPQPAAAAKPSPLLPPEEFKRQEDWRKAITAKPQPKKGCTPPKDVMVSRRRDGWAHCLRVVCRDGDAGVLRARRAPPSRSRAAARARGCRRPTGASPACRAGSTRR